MEPKEEVEHADILELNTIIETMRQEKEVLEQEKVCLPDAIWSWSNFNDG